MKKLLLTTIALCFMICAWAYDFESDGIYYNIIDAENFKVEVTNSGTPYTYYFSPLEIPETVTGSDYITTYTVTAIGDYAFCESMFNSVTIPGSVTTIGKYAFSDCSNLNSVTIVTPEFDPYEPEPDLNSVTIGTAAFNNCSLLSSIELPNSLTSIQDSVFVGCSRLSSITIPASVKSIGSEAFSGCFNISSISFEDFSSLDSIKFSAFFYCGSSSASITIPESVTFIDNYAFNRSGFAAIDIQASITIINSNVFSDCESLTSITIPSSVTSFDDYAISKCPKLNSISISENVEFIASSAFMGTGGTFEVDVNNLNYSSSENVLFNKDKTVLIHCSASKTNYAVPASVITIGEYAFSNCEVLSSVTIPNTVTTIDKNAFRYCITLTTINIPTSVSSISQYTFYNSGLTNITLPSGIDSINNNAFNSCKSLSSVTIPESVTYIGSSTFSYCSALTGITIPNKITTIPNNLFYNCSELTTINLPDIVNSIESYAFSKCSKLTTIAIPDSVKSIESSVFENCSSLTEITIPDAVESIKKYAFSGCSKLDSVNIPEAIVSIGMRAFKNCAGLNAISVNNKIPDNVTLGSSVFQNVNKNTCTLYVPSGTKEAYQAANQWKDFTNIVAPIIPQSLNVILVDSAVTAGGDGSSWAKAYNSLQDALDAAEKGDTIWIAKGTYYPSSGYDLCDVSGDSTRYYHFELKDSVAIYGGFAGTETSPGQRIDFRDGGANETILSGDFKGDDYIDTTAYYKIKNNDENCYHVFYHSPALALDSTALLDGVTITGGNANGTGAHANGGGMYNESCSPTLNNITFRRNNAFTHGGGVYNDSSSPTLNNVTFRNNTAFNSGGAMSDIDASPSLTNILFCNNHADAGGGIYNFNSSAILTNVTICGNKANGSGKGGGGILNDGSSETLKLKNCIVYGNTANTNNGNDFYLRQGGKITLEYCCYGNGSNDIGGDGDFTTDDFTPDDNCITSDPKFVFVEDGDCRVYGNSLCVDAGNNAYTQAINDIRGSGFPRKLDQYNHTTEGTIDMGAYEYQEGTDLMEPGAVIYVKTTEDGGNDSYDGETWASAYASLQKALEKAQSGKQIWIAKGTYKPSSAYSLTVDGNRDFHFEMKEGVEIYGGFAGTEDPATFDPAGRDFITNKTILSGDIGIEGNNSDNCYHVFFHPNGTGLTSATVLDGVTITEGNANTNGIAPHMYGGGMYNDHCSPTLRNVVVSGNSADKGGGMYNSNSASPTLINVLICDNSSDYGGGIYNSGSESSPTLINLTISGNSAATYGGGMYNYQSLTTLNNCIVWGNKASSGQDIYNFEGTVNLNYSCYGDVYGTVTPDANCTTGNPMFTDTAQSDYRLYGNSPCVDTGNDEYTTETNDIRGVSFGRKLLKIDHSQEGTIDMGAYEYKKGTDPLIHYVKTDGSDSNDGDAWETAYGTLQKALETAKKRDQIWVAKGTYQPSSAYSLTNSSRYYHFELKDSVAIYGGFAGTETFVDERTGFGPGGVNETILSGDIETSGNNSDNCYHVIYNPATPGLTVSSILDGFTITGGNADGDSPHNYGGGIYNASSSPFLRNITIRGNSASKNGGGITNNSSSPVLTNIIISKNNATEHGGGIYNDSSSPVLTNITINGNDAANGGGIANSNSLSILNNCIIWGNTATDNGDEIYISSSDVTTLNYSCYNNESGDVYDNGCTFTVTNNNITDNPEFVDVANGDYRIYGSSHCVDNGYNDYNTQTTDIRGSKFGRKLLKTDHTLEGSIDMGAYEYKESFDPKRPSRTMYVDDSATGGNNDGSNWANAYTSLQDALTEATSGDKIYIAAGTYKPGTTRDSYFSMKNGVAIYGGFEGTEDLTTFDLADRDFTVNETILSGDIGLEGDSANDCYHVFCHPSTITLDSTAILNGVTITGGNADSDTYPDNSGGGMFNYYSSPTLTNVKIINNTAYQGGGMFNRETASSPKLTNVIISNNTAVTSGGGIYTSGFPVLTNVAITENVANQGGGMYNYCSSPTLINVTISGNKTTAEGGGIYHRGDASIYLLTLKNSIVWDNTSGTNSGNEFYFFNSDIELHYSCYGNSEGDIQKGDNNTFTPDEHCITADPNFADTTKSDYRLYGNSPCVSTGNNSYNLESTDIRGQIRIQNTTIDMGAYEWTEGIDPEPTIRYVNNDVAGGNNDGTSWDNAYASLQDALTAAHDGDQIWIAAGTYYPTKQVGGTEDRFATFQMKNGVEIYGGFAGTEDPATFDLANRDFTTNKTILSGNIGTKEDNIDNCYHVFFHPEGLALDSTALLDGVTITGGYADGPLEDWHDCGGGMLNYGGMSNDGSSPTLVNVVISDNTAVFYGGGICNVFSSSPTLNNVVIKGNTSAGTGGGLLCVSSSPVLNNVTISGNTATDKGGGVYSNSSEPLTMNNCIVWGNTASSGGNEIYLNNTSVTMNYCCYGNDDGDIENTNSTFTPDANCTTSDPFFVNLSIGDFRIYGNSPCVNTGNNSYNPQSTDTRGKTRIQNTTIDMGAYEWTHGVDPGAFLSLFVQDTTLYLDSLGNASTIPSDLIVNAIGGNDTTLSISTFDCNNIDENKIAVSLLFKNAVVDTAIVDTAVVTVVDIIAPVLEVKNITVQLDSSGNASITAKDLVTGTSDNCSVADTTISIVAGEKSAAISVPTPVSDTLFFSCSDTGENKVEIKLTDKSGNTTINTVTVTVEDTIKPVLEVKNITVQLDSSGNASVTASDLVTSTSDNCSVADTTISIVTGEKSAAISVPTPVSDTLFFSCSDTGENKVEIKLTDNSGNTTINTVTVTVEDTIKPVLEVKNITVQLDSSGNVSITAKDLVTGTSDNCSVADTTISIVTGEKSAAISVPTPVSDTLFFSCSDTGENKVEIKLTDNSGNTTINTVTVTVEDTIKPVLEVKNITVQLDSSGNVSITAKDLVTGTSDNCSVADTTISIVTGEKSAAISVPTPVSDTLFFSCSDTGENKVEIKLTDNSGNTTINTVTVTVEDTIKPVLEVKNITVQLDSSGNASITAKDLVTGTSDNCSVADTTISIVTGEKSAAISVPAPVSDTLFFSCSDTGENKVEIKLTDKSGNTTINMVTVTVEDTIKPVLDVKNITVQLDSSGNASVTAKDLVTSTSDNCSVADTTISIVTGEKSAAISVPAPVSDTLFFSCSDTGENKVEIKLTDNSGNTTINMVTVTVEDTIKPVLEVKNITVQLDSSGNASVTAKDLVTGTLDNCSVADTTISIVTGEKSAAISVPTPVSDTLFFSCSDTGENKVEIKLTDNSGNTTVNTVTVTVEDTIKPVLEVKNITVQLDSSGNASVTAGDLVTGTSDNCSVADTTISIVTGEKSAAISVPTPVSDTLFFSCSDTGENKVEIKLTDNSGNTTINTVTVTVEDTIKPVLEVKNITVQLDSSGNASITAKDLVTGTSDNCSVADTTISIVTGEKSAAISVPAPVSDTLFFSCSDTGENKVEIKLTDNSGNTTINTVTVTVEDTIKPVLEVKNITVQLDSSGNASVTAKDLVTGTSDNCSVADTTISIVTGEKSAAISVPTPVSDTLFFSCSDTGENKVEIKLTDKSGNTNIDTVTVTVEDTIKPVLDVKNITVQLDSSGNASIIAGDLVTSTSDNCSVADTTISKSIFDCSNLGENKIVVTLYDASDNSVTDTALVTVEDTIKPVLDVKNITVQLDSSGNASITTSDLVTSTSDNCSVADATISKSTFDCSNVGVNIVALTLYDFSGNTSFCTSVVTVKDNIAPVIVPVLNIDTVLVPGICEGKIDYPDIVAGDNCEVELELIAGLGEGGIFPTGTTTETWVATDAAGNTDTLSFDVVVTAENTLPTLDPIANVTVDEDTGSVMVGLSGISSGEDCSAQGLVISAKSSDETLTDTIIVGYTTGAATATLEILLAPGMGGTAKITVAVEDSEGGKIEKSFMLTVNAVNDAPYLITPIADQAVHASYVLKIPVSPVLGEMFDDVDDDVLVITAAIEGPDTLPGWATFENDTLIFRPTIADTGCVNIVITATDTSGATDRDTFEVCVDGYPVGIEDLDEGSFEVAMYPNPTAGKVNLEFKSGVYDVELSVMDITGKTVFRKSYTASGRIVFDMSDKIAGMYFVKMDIDGTQVVKKLIVKK